MEEDGVRVRRQAPEFCAGAPRVAKRRSFALEHQGSLCTIDRARSSIATPRAKLQRHASRSGSLY